MDSEIKPRTEETHQAITRYFIDIAKRYADLKMDDRSWTTDSASGAVSSIFGYSKIHCTLAFPGGLVLNFDSNRMPIDWEPTDPFPGQATFNVDPAELKGASDITYEAAGLSIGTGGFQITWYREHKYIGHGEFYGQGIPLSPPGGGWGRFS